MAPKKKEEVEAVVLFPEIEIDGLVVKPWSLGTLAAVSPHIEAIFSKMVERNVDIEFSIASLMRMYFSAAPNLVPIISKTVGIPETEVEKFDLDKASRILRTIWEQNKEQLKNVFTLFGTALIGEKEPEESTQ